MWQANARPLAQVMSYFELKIMAVCLTLSCFVHLMDAVSERLPE